MDGALRPGYAPQKDGSVLLVSPGKNDGTNRRSIQFSIAKDKAESNAEFSTCMNMREAEHDLCEYVKIHHADAERRF